MPASTPERIYLDHNATTPVFPEVVEAMRACWSEPYLNPASQHEFGRRARRVLEDARDRIAELLGANTSGSTPDRVIFTSGGTEANNLAIRGLLPQPAATPHSSTARSSNVQLIISAIEHPSITSRSPSTFASSRLLNVDQSRRRSATASVRVERLCQRLLRSATRTRRRHARQQRNRRHPTHRRTRRDLQSTTTSRSTPTPPKPPASSR